MSRACANIASSLHTKNREIRIFVIIIFFFFFFFLILAPDHHVTLSCRSHVRVGDTLRSAALIKHVSHNRIVFVYRTARLGHGSRTGQDGVLLYQTTRVPPHMYFTMFTYRAGWSVVVPDNTSSTPHVLHHVHVQGRMEYWYTGQLCSHVVHDIGNAI